MDEITENKIDINTLPLDIKTNIFKICNINEISKTQKNQIIEKQMVSEVSDVTFEVFELNMFSRVRVKILKFYLN